MSEPPRELGRMKGSTIRAFFIWYDRQAGPGKVRAAALTLDPEVAETFQLDRPALGVLPNRWVDAEPLHRMLDHVFADTPKDVLDDVAERAGHAMVEEMIGS